ncbi:MAG: glutathione peroxidase [Lachnospiraceae bacterium]|nr:glutathione peroxidase [Lachnospiraceae bacterium]
MCRELNLSSFFVKDANHSLETGNIQQDLDNLRQITLQIEDYLTDTSIYNFKVIARDGSLTSMSDYRGKVLLIINTATGCGYTPQYERLERIYRTYHKEGFEILDFPCNQFDKQAPGNTNSIHKFCTARYDISFTQFRKCDVNGKNELELYSFLKHAQGFHGFEDNQDSEYLRKKLENQQPGYEHSSDIKWNFTKFLVDREGNVVARFEPTDNMDKMEQTIIDLLRTE